MHRICFFLLISVLSTTHIYAQSNVGMLRLDPTFATDGVWQHDFGNTNDYITAFNTFHYRTKDANTFASIIVAGKVYSVSGEQITFGMSRLSPTGVPDSSFGINGNAQYSWGLIDYSNSIIVPDSLTIVAAGGSSSPHGNGYSIEPALFRFKANGDPDSTFGIKGRDLLYFDTGSTGEFMSVDTLQNPLRYLATGYSNYSKDAHNGFAAIRVNVSGVLDSSFGTNGKAIVPYPLRSAIGYIRPSDKKIYFIGTDTAANPEIVLCLLTPDGKADASFGSGGIKQTGIHLAIQGKAVISAILKSSYLFAVAPISQPISATPFAMIQFKDNGDLDPQFGSIGLVPAPAVVSNMTVNGIFISNDGGHILAGSVDSGGSMGAAIKIFPNGVIDPNFGHHGFLAIDLQTGSDNYLLNFSTLGKDENDNNRRKYLGIGGSRATNNDFLVVRFDSVLKSGVMSTSGNQDIAIFPNPATDFLNIRAQDKSILSLSIINTLGHSVLEFHSGEIPSVIDIRALTNGLYYCGYETPKGRQALSFVVCR